LVGSKVAQRACEKVEVKAMKWVLSKGKKKAD